MKKKNMLVQISAGRGPIECRWVVGQVLKRFLIEVEKLDCTSTIISFIGDETKEELLSVVVEITGNDVHEKLRCWVGTIQWIGQSTFRKNVKRKNWFVSVEKYSISNRLPFTEDDVAFVSFRASGPGGQHRNKVETAIRAIHKPTNVSAYASDCKSQMQNRKEALRRLRAKFYDLEVLKEKELDSEKWNSHMTLERGNAVMVFVGTKFKRRK